MFRKMVFLSLLTIGTIVILSGCAPTSSPNQPGPTQKPETLAPTDVPTPEIEYEIPSFFSIPDQIMLPDEDFLRIDLTDYVYRADPASEEIVWAAESDPELSATFDGPVMQVERSSLIWHKITSIQVEVCNPGNKCGHTEIDFNVMGNIENGIFHTQVDGIIIESNGTKIMIDALFINPEGSNHPKTLLAMSEAAPPYDQADLILVTHHHSDHFDADLIVENMLHNPKATLLSTDLVVELLAEVEEFDQIADRVIGIEAAPGMHEVVSAAGVEIEVIYLSHGNLEEMPNFGYLFILDGNTFFHTGDVVLDDEPLSTFIDYGLPERDIDYAFVPYFMLTRESFFPYATDGIAPKYLVPVHVSARDKLTGSLFETIESNFDNLLAFRNDFDWYSFDKE